MSIEAQLERLVSPQELGHFSARDGLPDLPLVAPQSEAGMAEFLQAAAMDDWKLVVIGSGSKLSWYPAPTNVDAILSSAQLSGVSAYEPEDGTLSAWAGTPFSKLEETVRAGGHHLSPEVPRPDVATLGGVVASASSGFDRLRYGAVRENVLGLRVALPDGNVVKSGGRLVKNVTGYDLHRLLCGSHGTLGVITEVSLRLYPWPEEAGLLTATYPTREEALSKARETAVLPVRPVAIVVTDLEPGEGHRLEFFLAGRDDVIQWESEHLHAAVGELQATFGAVARERRRAARDAACPQEEPGGWAPLRFHCRPTQLVETVAAIERSAEAQGDRARFLLDPALATGMVRFENGAELARIANELRNEAIPATHWWTGSFPTPAPGALALMERLRAALDPDAVFAAGRFLLT